MSKSAPFTPEMVHTQLRAVYIKRIKDTHFEGIFYYTMEFLTTRKCDISKGGKSGNFFCRQGR